MAVIVVMMMVMVVLMAVVVVMMMVVLMEYHIKGTSFDTAGSAASDLIMQSPDAKTFENGIKFFHTAAQIDECGNSHIPGDTGASFKVKCFPHERTSYFLLILRRIRQAMTPAPKPLSIFTTAIPSAHELSMARSGATPPKLAP